MRVVELKLSKKDVLQNSVKFQDTVKKICWCNDKGELGNGWDFFLRVFLSESNWSKDNTIIEDGFLKEITLNKSLDTFSYDYDSNNITYKINWVE